jgi:hypothetical protein
MSLPCGSRCLGQQSTVVGAVPDPNGLGGNMKRKLLPWVFVLSLVCVAATPALAAEHHPPKFGVHSTQCDSGSNQPNCPGGH